MLKRLVEEYVNNFNLRKFYVLGFWCFIVIALGNVYTTAHYWIVYGLGDKFSKSAGILFNIGLVLMFRYFKKQQPTSKEAKIQEDEINDLLSDFKD